MKDQKLKETHQFTMILSEKYYNNYDEWLRVGFALHNTDPRLFLSWLYFSSQSDKFNFDEYVMPFDLTAKLKEASGNMFNIGQELKTELHPFIVGSKGLENIVGCIGESCCSTGTVYDIGSDQCVEVKCPATGQPSNYKKYE